MKKGLFFSFVMMYIFVTASNAQESNMVVTGKYEQTPFELFAKDIERQLPVTFMYHPDIVDSLTVTAILNKESLESGLKRVFAGTNIKFFIM